MSPLSRTVIVSRQCLVTSLVSHIPGTTGGTVGHCDGIVCPHYQLFRLADAVGVSLMLRLVSPMLSSGLA